MTKHLVLCAEANNDPSQNEGWELIRVEPNKPNPNLRYRIDNVSHKLLKSLNNRTRDLLDIATYIYHADNSVKRGTNKDVFNEKWSRNFKFIIPVRNPEIWNEISTANLLVELMEYLTEDIFEFQFIKRNTREEQLVINGFSESLPYGGKGDCVLLFSGGMDSLAGIVDYYSKGRKPILASHVSRMNLEHTQTKLAKSIRQKFTDWDFPQINIEINRIGREAEEVSQRSRSLLYFSFGALIAVELGLKEIVVAENGVTTFNLPRSGQTYGAQASRSTHPKVISLFEQLLDKTISAGIKITTPLLWNTRVENIEILKNNNCLDLLTLSSSCNHSRRPTIHPHCGTCSQCVDRRFAVEYLKLGNLDEEITSYEKDIFVDSLEPGEETMQSISPVQFLLDYRNRDINSFLQEYGIVFDALEYLEGDFEDNARRIYNLYGRFADIIQNVMEVKISQNWLEIISNELPESSLLMKCRDNSSIKSSIPLNKSMSELIERIENCPYSENKIHEDLCEEVLSFLFCDYVDPNSALGKPHHQFNNNGGYQRRDLVFENIATEGFWFKIRTEYQADGIIVDAKNYQDEIDASVLYDFAKYLKVKGLGMFGIIVARKNPQEVNLPEKKERLSGIVKAQEDLWRNDHKMIIILDDNDLIAMLKNKTNNLVPSDLIWNKIFDLKSRI